MLLNEFLKKHRKVQEMQKALSPQSWKNKLYNPKSRIQLELNKSAPELVAHKR